MVQGLLTALIVAGCAVYVAWALLLPAALRRRVATALLKRRWPTAVRRWLQAAARVPAACDCDGCDAAPGKATVPPGVQPVHWAPRRRH
jgi:hypothetical protein